MYNAESYDQRKVICLKKCEKKVKFLLIEFQSVMSLKIIGMTFCKEA